MRFSTLIGAIATALLAMAWTGAAWAQDAYRIQPGDTLRIEVIEDSSLNRNVLVSPDGRISVPLAGTFGVAGRSVEAVQSDLSSLLAPNFATAPTVFVGVQGLGERAPVGGVAEPVTIDVYVLGEVGNPGRLEIEPGTTVLQLFALTGGFTNFAAKKRIQLRRPDHGGEKIYNLNYSAIESGRSPNGRVVLRDEDVILVPQRRLFE